MRISDWSSDVCSSDLPFLQIGEGRHLAVPDDQQLAVEHRVEIERRRQIGKALRYLVAGAGVDAARISARDDLHPDAVPIPFGAEIGGDRSEERRVGKEGGSTWRTGWTPYK